MYRQLFIVVLKVAWCHCYAAYDRFEGFDQLQTTAKVPIPNLHTHTNNNTRTARNPSKTHKVKFKCPEEERPRNIGAYEVPTQRDMMLLTGRTLKRMFGNYHQKALFLLDDIQKATRATLEVEQNCPSNKPLYRQCVTRVSKQSEELTKSLVISLEKQRHDVAAFSEGTICSLSGLKEDPVKLIKILAVEEASLEFALPAFLRFLSACSNYCISSYKQALMPLRHMADSDVVMKHFLARKNYEHHTNSSPSPNNQPDESSKE